MSQATLIETKLFPPRRRPDVLARSRLLEFLHEHITNKLLLICAPAGYGKTTLLVDYTHDLDIPVCWLSLDESDRDPAAFLDYFVATIASRFPQFRPDLPTSMWGVWDDVRINRLTTVLVNEMQHSISDLFIIVLDDYHLVNESDVINQLLDRILTHLPEQCQFIISSRTEPTLTPRGLALLTVQRQVAALGVSQLRFTAAEVRALVKRNFGQEISEEAANLLAYESEGWITGILLTAQYLERGLLTAMGEGRGSRQRLYDYLTNEVLAQQPPQVRRFLEESAVLSEMSAELCDELRDSTDSAELLSHVEQQNLFLVSVPRNGQAWYRYHHLFRDLLLERLDRRDPEHALRLHARAGDLMQRRQQWDQAIHHYLKGGEPGRAARLVLDARDEIRHVGRWQTLGQWLDLLPAELYETFPHLSWMRGRVLSETGAPELAVEHLEKARKGLTASDDPVTLARVLHDLAVALRLQGHLHAGREVLTELLELVEHPDVSASDIYPMALCEAGIVRSRLGDLEQGNLYLRQALQHFERAKSPFNRAVVHDALGSNLGETGNLTGAQIQFERALALWESIDRPAPIAVTLNNLGVIYSARGEYSQAREAYQRALHEARRNGVLRVEAFAMAGLGDVCRDSGEWEQALAAYAESQALAEQVAEQQLTMYLLDASAETCRRMGNYVQALALARRAYEWAQEHSATLDLGRSAITLGAISYEQARVEQALRYLDQACDLLQASQANRELATARLHRAQAYYQAARRQDALAELERMVDCLLQLGYDAFLIPLVTRMRPLIEYAVAQGVGGQLLKALFAEALQTNGPPVPVDQVVLAEPEPFLSIFGLGNARAEIGARVITSTDWRAMTARDIFFFLLCKGPATKDQLASTFWPDLSPGKLRSTFHITIYRLRRATEPLETVLFESNLYQFNRRLAYSFDVDEFERFAAQADTIAPINALQAIELYWRAIDLYRGDFMADYASAMDEWRVIKASELAEKYLTALEHLGALLIRQRELQSALEVYQRAVHYDPYRESAQRGIMRCYVALGRRAEALRYYGELKAFIRAELKADLTPETMTLYQKILANKSLD
jgi:ATP/maltotriose-dependent transcriptional regulator MalT/DNA-binding SARP family transcriptional activator